MKRNMSFVTVFAALAFVCLSMPALAQSKAKPIELSLSSNFPPAYGAEIATAKWAQEVEKRTQGKVKITMFHVGTLTAPPNTYEGVVKGVADIGQSVFSYTRGRFPLMEVIDLPGYPMNAIIPSLVAQDIYDKYKPKELNDVHVLYVHVHMPGVIYMANKQVTKLEDLKGLRIRATGLATDLVKALGATPVSMPKNDQYDSLQKGVVDGTVGSPNELKGWKLSEVTKSSIYVPKTGNANAFFVVMNKRKWNSLPADVQKVFTQVSAEWPLFMGKAWNEIDLEGYNYGKERKHIFIFPPAEEQARWVKALQPLNDAWVKEASAKGVPAKEALEYRRQLIEKYSKMYPSVFK
jgi:TRAP-type transport system periplasmic protein